MSWNLIKGNHKSLTKNFKHSHTNMNVFPQFHAFRICFHLSCISHFTARKSKMDSRNYVNSENYAKLLREKIKRETKVVRTQNKIQQQQLQQKPLCPRKPKKLSEKWLKQHQQQQQQQLKPEVNNECRKIQTVNAPSISDNDLLSEIDDELQGSAKGFVFKKGN
jgi:hypothetical protein